jgi:hypothetical protein
MNVVEESDCARVPMKPTNNEGSTSAESVEGRVPTKENGVEPHTQPTQSGISVSQGLDGVAGRRGITSRNGLPPYCTISLSIYYGRASMPNNGMRHPAWTAWMQPGDGILVTDFYLFAKATKNDL